MIPVGTKIFVLIIEVFSNVLNLERLLREVPLYCLLWFVECLLIDCSIRVFRFCNDFGFESTRFLSPVAAMTRLLHFQTRNIDIIISLKFGSTGIISFQPETNIMVSHYTKSEYRAVSSDH